MWYGKDAWRLGSKAQLDQNLILARMNWFKMLFHTKIIKAIQSQSGRVPSSWLRTLIVEMRGKTFHKDLKVRDRDDGFFRGETLLELAKSCQTGSWTPREFIQISRCRYWAIHSKHRGFVFGLSLYQSSLRGLGITLCPYRCHFILPNESSWSLAFWGIMTNWRTQDSQIQKWSNKSFSSEYPNKD